MRKIRIATVFSGIGAAEQAFEQLDLPHEIIFACDNGERYLKEDLKTIQKNIENLDENEIQKYIEDLYEKTKKINNVKKSYIANYGDKLGKWYEDIRFLNGKKYKNNIDIIIGGSPCQSFSTYGKRKGLEDARGTLFYDYARIIQEINPKIFIFENVTGLLNHDKGKTWDIIKNIFESLHYKIYFDVLDAQNYNLPQMRKRLFVVGIRNDINRSFNFPEKKELEHTVDYYLDSYVENKYYLGFKGFRYVTTPDRNEGRARVNRNIIGCQTANQQFNWTGDFRVEFPEERHRNDERIYIGNYDNHEAVARKLTPNECLRLMGFKNFNIVVPDQVMYRQVGNSIAVPVLKEIIKEIIEVI